MEASGLLPGGCAAGQRTLLEFYRRGFTDAARGAPPFAERCKSTALGRREACLGATLQKIGWPGAILGTETTGKQPWRPLGEIPRSLIRLRGVFS